jgi:hypothetical protein
VDPTDEEWQLVSSSEAIGCQTMPNRLAEGMNRFLKYERVIKDDPEEISIIIGKRKQGTGNRKR